MGVASVLPLFPLPHPYPLLPHPYPLLPPLRAGCQAWSQRRSENYVHPGKPEGSGEGSPSLHQLALQQPGFPSFAPHSAQPSESALLLGPLFPASPFLD